MELDVPARQSLRVLVTSAGLTVCVWNLPNVSEQLDHTLVFTLHADETRPSILIAIDSVSTETVTYHLPWEKLCALRDGLYRVSWQIGASFVHATQERLPLVNLGRAAVTKTVDTSRSHASGHYIRHSLLFSPDEMSRLFLQGKRRFETGFPNGLLHHRIGLCTFNPHVKWTPNLEKDPYRNTLSNPRGKDNIWDPSAKTTAPMDAMIVYGTARIARVSVETRMAYTGAFEETVGVVVLDKVKMWDTPVLLPEVYSKKETGITTIYSDLKDAKRGQTDGYVHTLRAIKEDLGGQDARQAESV